MTFDIGQIIGDYEIVGHLGRGGMGSVYKVRNLVSDRMEAMKVLLPDVQSSADLAERFHREIRLHASLRHPNIAQLLTAFRRDNQLLMILELVDGIGLDEILHRGPMAPGDAVACIVQALQALNYAHEHGVIHRDVKPSNIVVLPDGVVKLLDFGIARGDSDLRLTLSGMVVGSLSYMAPEQVSGQPSDARSDVYSIGVTLYQAVTGVLPFRGDSQYEIMRAQISAVPVPPDEVNPALSPALSAVILQSLEKTPARRFQTAAEFQSALEPFRTGDTRVIARDFPEPAASSPNRIPSSSQVDSSALELIARHLADFVGPIARRLVEAKSRGVASTEALCQALSAEIASAPDRSAFLRACREQLLLPVTPTPARSAALSAAAAFDAALIERIRRELAAYVGPLAKVIVDRTVKKARTPDELIAMLASEIDTPAERQKFLHAFR